MGLFAALAGLALATLAAVALAVLFADGPTPARAHPHADAGLDILRDRRPQDYDPYAGDGRPS